MYGRRLRRDRPQAYLYGEYEAVKGLGVFLSGMGIAPAAWLLWKRQRRGFPVYPQKKDRGGLLRASHRTPVLADDTSRRLMDADNTFIRIAMPLMGNRGANMITETVEAYFNTLK